MEAGRRFRTHMWARAQASRAEAKLPMAIHRSRIARAKELGLSYADYSAIRATSGRDIAGYLISSNALGVQAGRVPPQASVTERLMALRHVLRVGLAHPPLSPAALLERVAGLDLAFAAPPLLGSCLRSARRWPGRRGACRPRGWWRSPRLAWNATG